MRDLLLMAAITDAGAPASALGRIKVVMGERGLPVQLQLQLQDENCRADAECAQS